MPPFAKLSNELALYLLAYLSPVDLAHFALTCRSHYAVATDDELWLSLCIDAIQPHLHPHSIDHQCFGESYLRRHKNSFLHSESDVTDNERAFYGLYSALIGPHMWMMGWWSQGQHSYRPEANSPLLSVSSFRSLGTPQPESQRGSIWKVSFAFEEHSDHSLVMAIVGQKVTVAGIKQSLTEEFFETVHPNVRVWPNGMLVDRESGTLSITNFKLGRIVLPMVLAPKRDDDEDDDDAASPDPVFKIRNLKNHGLTTSIGFRELTSYGVEIVKGEMSIRWDDLIDEQRRNQLKSHAPFPPPGLFPLLRNVTEDSLRVPTMMLHATKPHRDLDRRFFPPSLIPIVAPDAPRSHFPHLQQLAEPGIYASSYGAHGIEFLNVTTRFLTASDFASPPTYPWEGTLSKSTSTTDNDLGLFSPSVGWSSAEMSFSPEEPKVGARVIEVTKITGDSNVPRGQVSILAFLDDPLVNQVALQEQLSSSMHEVSKRRFPWPVRANLAETDEDPLERPFEPSTGVDLPAFGRIAFVGFSRPRWTNCVMHVEERQKFTVWWQELDNVSTFTKLSTLKY